MTEQVNVQSLSDIKSLIEENNAALRDAIQALEVLNNRILQQPNDQMVPQPAEVVPQPAEVVPQPPQMLPNNYPGYTMHPRFGFMQG